MYSALQGLLCVFSLINLAGLVFSIDIVLTGMSAILKPKEVLLISGK